MKFPLVLIAILSLASCSSLYKTPNKIKVLKTAQYEGGNRQNGVVYLYFTYNPLSEDVQLNIPESEANASQICKNWGYSQAKIHQKEFQARCVKFDFSKGDCLKYKATITAICQ